MPESPTLETVAEQLKEMPRPPLRFKIDDDKSIKMTYGLLMDLQRLLPDATQALALVLSDPYTKDYVVRRVMTPFNGTVTDIDKLIPSEEIDLIPEQVEAILDWVVQHVLHFFAQRAGNIASAGKMFQTALPSLFTNGSQPSAGMTPSAGPSESPKTD